MANALSPEAARDDWFDAVEDGFAAVEVCCAPTAVANAITISITSGILMSLTPLLAVPYPSSGSGRKRHARDADSSIKVGRQIALCRGRARDGRCEEAEFAPRVVERDSSSA